MQGQTQISNILALKPSSANSGNGSEKNRNESAAQNGEAFKRMLDGPARSNAAQIERQNAAAGRPLDTRPEPNGPVETGAPIQRAAGAEKPAEKPAPSANSLESMQPEDVRQFLEDLPEGELKALGDQVESILADLRAQLEAGELDPDAEAALKDLLTALEEEAPVSEIAQLLEALPVNLLPGGANRFPEAKNLRDLLGGSGAAYLRQLASEVGANQRDLSLSSKAGGSDSALSSLANILDSSQGAELDDLLTNGKDLSTSANKENFVKMLQAVAGQEGTNPRAMELGQNNTSASSLASLDANARAQPLQPSERQFMVQSEVRVPVNQGQWGQAVGQRVLWLAAQNVSSAELRLDPPDLGPMQVRVSSHQDQISVTFTSAQPAVREALDQNATRLREMFAEQGLDLVDVNVSDQSGGEQTAGEEGHEGRGGQGGHGNDVDADDGRVSERLVATSLVDHYA